MAATASIYEISALYRRGLRIVKLLEGQRRRRLCAFRTRDILSRAIQARKANDADKASELLVEADIYLDQIGAQANHLQDLSRSPRNLVVPLDIYDPSPSSAPLSSSSTFAQASTLLDSLPSRRVSEEERRGSVDNVFAGRLFQGPEPSWLRKTDKDLETVIKRAERGKG